MRNRYSIKVNLIEILKNADLQDVEFYVHADNKDQAFNEFSEMGLKLSLSNDDEPWLNDWFLSEFKEEQLLKIDQIKKIIFQNQLHVEFDLSIIALVGTRMRQQIGISSTLFDALSHNGINVKAIAQGSTERNISVVIDRKNLKKALNTLHESFFLSDTKKYSLFLVGAGNVGKTLLQQIAQ